MTYRVLQEEDRPILEASLALDIEHPDTKVDFFYNPRTICFVYDDSDGPVLYARSAKTLRLDLHYVNNLDAKKNMRVMMEHFPDLVGLAQNNGYSDVMFNSTSPLLRKFCIKRLGFMEASNELRRDI